MASKNNKKASAFRIVIFCLAWAAWLFVAVALVTYDHNDPPSHDVFIPGGGPIGETVIHNRCGEVGAAVAYHLFETIGPGVFVGMLLLGSALLVWSRGEKVGQMPLRLMGSALLIATVSAVASMFFRAGETTLSEGPGGWLGIYLADFLRHKFNSVGTWLILVPTVLIGALLAMDEIVLALPHVLARGWKKVPTEQLAGAATGVAGGFMNSFRGWVDELVKKGAHMGGMREKNKKEEKLKRDLRNPREIAGAPEHETTQAIKNPPEPAEPAEMDSPIPEVPAQKIADAGKPLNPDEILVRKPTAARFVVPQKPIPPTQKQDLGNYRLPGLDLLDEAEEINTEGQEQRVREKARVLEACLDSFKIDGKVVAIDTGPVVTLYELELAPGVKSSQVGALSKDIARALMSPPVRIIDNIPGKSTMGIEVPNTEKEKVRLKELMQLGGDQIEKMALPMCLGKDASGNPLIEDLAKIPHLLIAGTTGSGKSVCINSIIMTILLTQRPDHVKMIMVDPKMVEMQDYASIPHLMAPIIDDMSKAESILEWATQKMDERYETLSEAKVRHIKEYNKLGKLEILQRMGITNEDEAAQVPGHLPYIVIIIDELADLMMTSQEVEGHIVRVAQKARAVGIHLILATQRPEAQVVTGLIKSNMPGRICFQVRSRLDSRIMLDQSGGELLLGQGDLLMLRPTGGSLLRGQGTFVDDAEIKGVCKFLKEIAQPEFHPELMQLGTAGGLGEGEEKDELFNAAVDIMIESGRGSVSLIQRRLNIGYSRASRIIDQLRRSGVVGAYKGSMASEVTVTKEEWEAMKAAEARDRANGIAAGGAIGNTGAGSGAGKSAGFAQQVNSTFDEDDDDDGVPNELPGEHRM